MVYQLFSPADLEADTLRLLPLISLFPPATLSVAIDTYHDQITLPIRLPGFFNTTSSPVGWFGNGAPGDYPIPEVEQEIFTSNAVVGEISRPLSLNFGSKTYTNYSYGASMNLPRLSCTTTYVTELDDPLRNATMTWLGKYGICTDPGCITCTSAMDPTTWALYANCTGQWLQMNGLYMGLTYINDGRFPRDNMVTSITGGESDGNIILILAPNSSHATVSNCTATNSTVDFTVQYVDGVPTITTNSIVDHGTYWNYENTGYVVRIEDISAVSRWVTGIFGYIGGYKAFYYRNITDGMDSTYYTTGSILGTVLRFAKDFYEVQKAIVLGGNYGAPLIQLPELGQVRNMTMAQMVEELSLNISLSYMSQDYLRYALYEVNKVMDVDMGYSYEAPADVQVSSTENIYAYDSQNLFISYGAGILTTLISIIIGIVSFWKNGVRLENKASTIGALMQHQHVSALLRGKAGTGLGKTVENVRVRLERRYRQELEFVPEGFVAE